jgi:hypothetical protein
MGMFDKLFGGGESSKRAVEAPAVPNSDNSDDRAWKDVSALNRMACPIPFV